MLVLHYIVLPGFIPHLDFGGHHCPSLCDNTVGDNLWQRMSNLADV
jgi:hypothetical protein